MEIVVEPVAAEHLIDLRHATLRNGYPRESAMFEGDHEPGSVHVAAMLGRAVIGCASLHQRPYEAQAAWQLRGMAVSAEHRKLGVGRRVLAALEDHAARTPYSSLLWCNARRLAVPFYQRAGWEIVSAEFEIPTAGPHFRMVKRLANPG